MRAFLFPGQGTQRVGMGCALHDRHEAAREVFERADARLGFALSELCFRGQPDQLTATRVAQPAIFTVSAASLAVLRAHGVDCALAAGHSVGELTALHAAGCLDLEEALDLVEARARIMEHVPKPGAMAAVVGIERDVVEHACRAARSLGAVGIGLHNGPRNLVISGSVIAVDAAIEHCRAAGALRVTKLHTQHAFHSSLMEPVVAEWRAHVASLSIDPPRIPVPLNALGRPARDLDELRTALVDQVAHPVRWLDCLRSLRALGAEDHVEVGDSKVLSALVRNADRDAAVVTTADARALRRLLASGGARVAVH